jgi:hypothetical protein
MRHNHPMWTWLVTPTERPRTPTSVAPGRDTGIFWPSLFVEHAAMWVLHRPWLALVAMAAVAVWVAGRVMFAGWRHRHHANHAQLIIIAPPPEVDPARARSVGEPRWHAYPGVAPATYLRNTACGVGVPVDRTATFGPFVFALPVVAVRQRQRPSQRRATVPQSRD